MSTAWKPPDLPASAELAPWERADFDWKAWYLTDEDDMGQGGEQYDDISHLTGVLRQWRHERGLSEEDLYVGADQFFDLHPSDPWPRVSPDVYLVKGPVPVPRPTSWAWGSKKPLVAVEIVSEEWRKDYEINPLKYQRLEVKELVLFDADWLLKPRRSRRATHPTRAACTVYRPDAQGVLQIVDQGEGPFRSEFLGAWWVILQLPGTFRLSLARDAQGTDLILPREDAEHQRAEAERQRAEEAELRAEQAETEREAERQRAEWAEQRAEEADLVREAERQRAEAAETEREAERQRAEAERQRAESLAAELERLRALLGRGQTGE